jgi:hypothetical protein
MKVLIRNCLTSKFLTANGTWSKQMGEAADFNQSLRAWEEIDRRKLSGIEIVLSFDAREEEMAIQVNGCQKLNHSEPAGPARS